MVQLPETVTTVSFKDTFFNVYYIPVVIPIEAPAGPCPGCSQPANFQLVPKVMRIVCNEKKGRQGMEASEEERSQVTAVLLLRYEFQPMCSTHVGFRAFN